MLLVLVYKSRIPFYTWNVYRKEAVMLYFIVPHAVAISVGRRSHWSHAADVGSIIRLYKSLIHMLTKGLRCRQVNFSCEKSHDGHKKTDGAGAVWVILIDFGFSQQSMFRCWHLCLNEAAPSIKARRRGRFLPVGGCESMQQNWMLLWINEAPQPKATRQRGTRGKCNFYFFSLRVLSLLSPVWQWWTALTWWGEENAPIT